MLNDGAHAYAYNAESEIKSAAGVNYTGVYPERSRRNGDGNRVEKSSGKAYWYGAGTEILDESDLSGNITNEYVFFGGKRIAMRNVSSGTIYHYEDDMLGSARTMVQAGQTSPCYDGDFYPFGGERIITNTCTQNYKFEGKERDTETGNDDFGARYYSSRLGRWFSADWSSVPAPVPYANLTNPQTLNLYAMVSDNPETFADLDGHQCNTASTGSVGASDRNNCPGPAATKTAKPGDGFNTGDGLKASSTQQAQAPQQHNQPGASTVGAAVGAVVGGVVGGVVGAVSGAAGGTLVEPGGGTVVVGIVGGTEGAQTGASIGATAGAAAGALAPVVYTKTKDALRDLGTHLQTAIDHLGKLNGPDRNPNPRRTWRQTVRKSADNIDKQANRIPNAQLRNAAHFVADALRRLVGPD